MYYYAWGWWWILWAAIFLIFILGFSGWGFGGSRSRWSSKRLGDEGGVDRFGSYFPLSYPVGRFTGIGPKNYHRSDERILEEVSDRLLLHGDIDAKNIEVSVDHGIVILEGSADNRRIKRLVEEVAESVTGVLDVKNDLIVGGPKKAAPPAERKAA